MALSINRAGQRDIALFRLDPDRQVAAAVPIEPADNTLDIACSVVDPPRPDTPCSGGLVCEAISASGARCSYCDDGEYADCARQLIPRQAVVCQPAFLDLASCAACAP